MEDNKLDFKKLDHIKISLMETNSSIDSSTGKSDYTIKGSANFKFDDEIKKLLNNEELAKLLNMIYEDLRSSITREEVTSVGMWVDYDNLVYENSIKIETLNDMEEFGAEDIVPIYEFYKMTII